MRETNITLIYFLVHIVLPDENMAHVLLGPISIPL